MRFSRKLVTTSVIAAGGAVSIALTFSATAAAEPAPPPPAPGPAAPAGIPFMDQLTSAAANAPQLLQSAAAALAGTGSAATAPALPVTPPPAASASVTVPQPTLPGVPGVAEITKQPGVVPATTPSVPLPTAEATLPQVPGSPVPVPQQVTLPTDLAALLPAGVPLTNLVPANPPGATPGAPSLPSLLPVSALP